MKQIWKYNLQERAETLVHAPESWEPLHLAYQSQGLIRTPVVWAKVETRDPLIPRRIRCYGTGWNIPDDPGRYLGTLQDPDGLVFHYFEAKTEAPG